MGAATTFVWIQHHGAVLAASNSDRPGIRETWLGPLTRGERRCATVLAGPRPGPAPLRVRRTDDGYLLDGTAPWVTGWGLVDTLYLAARDGDDLIHYFLLDAAPARGLSVHTFGLVAVNASRTVDVTQRLVREATFLLVFGSRPANPAAPTHRIGGERRTDHPIPSLTMKLARNYGLESVVNFMINEGWRGGWGGRGWWCRWPGGRRRSGGGW
ncbi:acyl-CoA/acyl-ACP dehydrogenase [Micromonospora sp. NBC_01699]|uniref:hypothetical protein n=1 Tax=Micromonospora sp. NBC_01699 TaxID=2975984 RepID=UPI002E31DC97|nr:hypothetical protein [Micromonospora sp. NBC_01699]